MTGDPTDPSPAEPGRADATGPALAPAADAPAGDGPTPVVITEPGLYSDLASEDYHRDPVPGGSLSSSGARKLLPPGCPAKFAYDREHGEAPKAFYDFGHAAHKAVLTEGEAIVVIEAPDWRTKDARAQREAARAAGKIPMLDKDMGVVEDMAAALTAHPFASALFAPGSGWPEQSIFWRDQHTEVMRRARLDWLPHADADRRLIVPDYKTAAAADLESLQKAIHRHGYHQQAAWYLDAVKAIGLSPGGEPTFVFVFQEKEPPYVVTVVELELKSLAIGRLLNRRALETYAQCERTGQWPGYAEDVVLVELPHYVLNEYTDRELMSA